MEKILQFFGLFFGIVYIIIGIIFASMMQMISLRLKRKGKLVEKNILIMIIGEAISFIFECLLWPIFLAIKLRFEKKKCRA